MQHLTTHTDVRGSLTIVEEQCDFPFTMQRAYWIHGVPEGARRGYHASTSCHEFLIAVHGGVTVVLEDASGRTTTRLCEKDQGLHVPPYTWIELSDFTTDAVLMVLASESYQIETYINDHEQFLAVVGNHTVG